MLPSIFLYTVEEAATGEARCFAKYARALTLTARTRNPSHAHETVSHHSTFKYYTIIANTVYTCAAYTNIAYVCLCVCVLDQTKKKHRE